MKKILIFIIFSFIFVLSSCTISDQNQGGVNNYKPLITEEDVIDGYYDAIRSTDHKDSMNVKKEDIIVKQMYPTLRPDLVIVDITNSYNIVPFKIYRENIDKLLFVYGGTFNFYGYYNNQIHTIKSLYEQEVIDLELVCELFSHMSLATSKLSHTEYEIIREHISYGLIDRYFGRYDGYSAFTLCYTSNLCVTEPIRVLDVMFEFPYPDTHIRFVKDDEMISLSNQNLCVSKDSIYELFSLYTRSDKVNSELISMLFAPVVKVYQEYVSDFTIDDLYLEYYYGSSGDVHFYQFGSNVWLASIIDEDVTGFASSLRYGGGWATVYYDGNVYLVEEAISLGITTKEEAHSIIYG